MKISRMVYELEPYKDSIWASKVKADLRGQRSYFEKGLVDDENAAQFDEKTFLKRFDEDI